MNHTHLPKEVLLPVWVCRDNQGKKGDYVDLASIEYLVVWVSEPVWMLKGMKSLLSSWDWTRATWFLSP